MQLPRDAAGKVFQNWDAEPSIRANFCFVNRIPARHGVFTPLPAALHHELKRVLEFDGIHQLYCHQSQSWTAVKNNQSIVVPTSTASGKTLCFNLPIIDECIKLPSTRAIYLYPTKALAQDQNEKLHALFSNFPATIQVTSGVYDGDTPQSHRSAIRNKANIILSNPDMLHTGIMPHHTAWNEFFRNLRFVVIDELHMYRGVFGSHLSNIIRRLKRIAAFYGSDPQFILTSATIANPVELAEKLIEKPVQLIDEEGSPSGEKLFLLYNPPVIDPTLGIRASPLQESQRLIGDLLHYGLQTITFMRTRRSVEIMLKYLRDTQPGFQTRIEGYRSGYLPGERRAIEKRLREGDIRTVIATNALELGIDIGSLNAAVLVGYPGSIASTRQQAGRAGRKTEMSLSVLVASSDPLDQYLMQHPEYLIGKSPEQALIDPDNLLILLQHVRCAAFELPFDEHSGFGNVDPNVLAELLEVLTQAGDLHPANARFFWVSDQYPAAQVSLRSSSPDVVKLQDETDEQVKMVGIVDRESATWMVHPKAVYLHAGTSYFVHELDLENGIARLEQKELDFYTEPLTKTTIEKIHERNVEPHHGGHKHFGDIKVTTEVTGYRQLRWYTHENLGEGSLDLPPSHLYTSGYWISLSENTVNRLRDLGLWNNDPNEYGPGWDKLRLQIRTRDRFTCQICGTIEGDKTHHVHHKIPLRRFPSYLEANHPNNLITLCNTCHQKTEMNLRIRSGLSGFCFILQHLAPLFLMCDVGDIGAHYEPQSPLADNQPVVVIYDFVAGGIGLSKKLYEIDHLILPEAISLIESCPCATGCPSCVGPGGENGIGGKTETLAILKSLMGMDIVVQKR